MKEEGEFRQMTSLLVKLDELLTRLNNPVLPSETAANKENAIGGSCCGSR